MSNLVLAKKADRLTLDSREVAAMVRKEHKNLLRDIETYISYLEESNELKIEPVEFFIESSYTDTKGERRPNYQITKKGCEFIAHKLTGQKGTLFTATYINKFHEMEQALLVQASPKPKTLPTWDKTTLAHMRVAKEIAKMVGTRPEKAVSVALAMAQKDTGKNLDEYRKQLLPPVKEEDAEKLNATQVGESLNPPMKAARVNLLLEKLGFLKGNRVPEGKNGALVLAKSIPWQLTNEGLKYGAQVDATKEDISGAGNRHHWEGFQILWWPGIIKVLQEHLGGKSVAEDSENRRHH